MRKNTSRYELSKGGNNQWHFVNISLQSSDVHDVFTWTNSAGDDPILTIITKLFNLQELPGL